jgi:hypothetical protein
LIGSLTWTAVPRPGGALDADRAADRLDPVDQSGEPRTARRHYATPSVVADAQLEPALALPGADLRPRCLGVLGGVGQCLRGDVVGGHLDGLLKPFDAEVEPQVDRNRRP